MRTVTVYETILFDMSSFSTASYVPNFVLLQQHIFQKQQEL